MNIQIYGSKSCFDTKKAERYFKERRIKFQAIDLPRFGLSPKEFELVKSKAGLDAMINTKAKNYSSSFIAYLADDTAKAEKLMDDPSLITTPIVRNGREITIGFCPDVWKNWE
ncbi:MAG: ArsC family transcriptional regulator [Oscillospiraceae bacterium]|nr:ArsC family transcriptional regulator [Oscillospiraceae bacterium]